MAEQLRSQANDFPLAEGEIPPSDMPGSVIIPFRLKQGDPVEVLSNPEQLEKHEHLRNAVDTFRKDGKEVWGYWAAHKGIVLTAIGAAAAAAGVTGIGILIKKREPKE